MPILHWLNKDQAVTAAQKSTYRLLEEVPELSYGDADNENLLIQGDNLEALKALIPFYAGKVKCIFIDPPYNTQSAFEHYDDNLEHSKWLSLMYPRLELLRNFLSKDGVIWIQIDDKEGAYLRVICDEIFGRNNFMNSICIKTSDPSGHKTVNPSPYSQTEYLLMYAANRDLYKYEQRYVESNYDSGYNQFIVNRQDNYSDWKVVGLNQFVAERLGKKDTRTARKELGRVTFDLQVAQFALENADSVFQATAISNDAGKEIIALRDHSKKAENTVFYLERAEHEDIYCLNGRQIYFYKNKLKNIDGLSVPAKPLTNLWTDIPWNGISTEGGVKFKNGKKPERLIERCIELSSNEGDIVMDSFLGSGTTAAVAHKMNRRYIGIEMGEHAQTHCQTRLKKVVDGEQGGISKAVDWQGGGGFRFFKLGEAVFDEYGSLNSDIKFPTLAAHIWYLENKTPLQGQADSPLLGVNNGTAYYLLYNGILGDRRPQGGNVLTSAVLNELPDIQNQKKIVIYGESCRLGAARLQQANITFKQIPYDVGML